MLKVLPVPAATLLALLFLTRGLGGKRLELLKEAVPKLARVAVLYDPTNPPSVIEVKEVLPVAARALRLTIQPWEVRDADGFERVFAALNKERPDALYVPGSALMSANQKRIVGLVLKSRLPSVFTSREAVDAGGLLYYGADEAEQLPARRLLRGQDPEGSQACRSASGAADEV